MVASPREISSQCFGRARAIFAAGAAAGPDPVGDDLVRLALVSGVAALDTYLHTLVVRRLTTVRRAGDLPGALRKLDLPLPELIDLAEAIIEARREDRDARPWVAVKRAVRERLLSETFQSYDAVSKAISMAGLSGISDVAQLMTVQATDIRDTLGPIIHRRNQIVHEGDIARLERPQTVRMNSVDRTWVADSIAFLDDLVAGINVLAYPAEDPYAGFIP